MSKFSEFVMNILTEETNYKFKTGDIVKIKNKVGTINSIYPRDNDILYKVKYVIPNLSGPYEKNDGTIYYTRRDEKDYSFKFDFFQEEYIEPATQEDLDKQIRYCIEKTNRYN